MREQTLHQNKTTHTHTHTHNFLVKVLGFLSGRQKTLNLFLRNNNNNNNSKGSRGMGQVAPLYGVDPALVLTNPGVQ